MIILGGDDFPNELLPLGRDLSLHLGFGRGILRQIADAASLLGEVINDTARQG